MELDDDSNAHWLYHRCTTALISLQSPLSALELAIKVLQFIQSLEEDEDFDEFYNLMKNECMSQKRDLDLSFVYDVMERVSGLREDTEFSEEALRKVAASSFTVGNGCSSVEPAASENIGENSEGIAALGVDENFSSCDGNLFDGDKSTDNNKADSMEEVEETAACTVADVNTNDLCQQDVNFDELHCFQLRTRVLGLNIPTFNELWRYLQAAGWTYSNGKYHIPKAIERRNGRIAYDTEGTTKIIYRHFNLDDTITCDENTEQKSDGEDFDGGEGPEIFDNPNDLVTYLDEYCMTDYRATPSEIHAQQIAQSTKSKAYKRRNLQLRHELLEVAYRDRVRKRQEQTMDLSQSKYGHNHRPCDVCFKGPNILYPRVACRKCGLIVHTHCYGLSDYDKYEKNARTRAAVDAKGYFTCDVCMHSLVDDGVKQKVRYHASQSSGWRVHTHPNAVCPLCVKNSIIGGMVRIVLDDDDAGNGVADEKSRKRKSRRSSDMPEIWVHLFCINALPSKTGSAADIRIRDALAISGEIVQETESMRETTLRCEKCANREGNLVACKGTCGRFYHRLCLQIDYLGNDAKKEHICLACRNEVSRKTDNNLDVTSKVNARKDNSSKASTRQRKGAEEVDQYFGKKSGKKSSKNSDGASDIIVPTQQECIAEVKTLFRQSNVEVEFDKYEVQYQEQFQEWSFALATSQSILLYGLGSKISVLTSFGQHLAQEGDVISLNGYDPNFDMNAFLDCIDEIFCNGTEYQRSITQPTRDSNVNLLTKRATTIAKRIATTRSRPLFLLIHNIDGAGLRSVFAQEALAVLSANSNKNGSPLIRIAASVDNVNAAMVLWSPHVEYKFDWAWKKVHTYRPYIEEVRCMPQEESSKKIKRGKGSQTIGGGSAALKVLAYLAPRHTEALQALATLQLSNKSNPVSYNTLRDECVKKMLTSSDVNLRNILKELTDHKIVGTERDKEGNELLFVPSEIPIRDILNFKLQGNNHLTNK